MSETKTEKSKKIKKSTLCITGILCTLLIVITALFICSKAGLNEARGYIETIKNNRDILFMNTINGTMLYVPVSEDEAIAEATGTNGGKGLYLFTQMGDTVTISDDILISKQQNICDMMLSIIETGWTVKEDDRYITEIKGTSKIMELMTEQWGLSEGQTLGSLNNYGAVNSDKVRLELIVKPDELKHIEFAINIYVDEKAYSVYQGISLANDIQKPFPPEIYNYRQYEGISTDDERLENYLKTVIDYFKTVAEVINVNDIK